MNEIGVGAGVGEFIAKEVKTWIELALIETVMSVKTLSNSMHWTPENIDAALSEESLTAALMQKYLIREATSRQIGNKIGAFSRTSSPN